MHGTEPRFVRGIEQFNRGEFFQAHETWEEIWLKASGEEKRFLQGTIQIAAAFHHWERGNPRGALSLLRRAVTALEGFPRSYAGIQVGRLRRETTRWVAILERGGVLHALPHIQSVSSARQKGAVSAESTLR